MSELTLPARRFKRGPASLTSSEEDLESQRVAADAIVGAITQLANDACSAGDDAQDSRTASFVHVEHLLQRSFDYPV
jgi:hypothetical protein